MNNDKLITFLSTSALAVCIVNFDVKPHESIISMDKSDIIYSQSSSNIESFNEFSTSDLKPNTSMALLDNEDEYTYRMPKAGSFKVKLSKNSFIDKKWL